MNILTARVAGSPDALADSVRSQCQEPLAFGWIMCRLAFDAERVAPLVPGYPCQERFTRWSVRADQCLMPLIDEHQAQLGDPHSDRGIVCLDTGRAVSVMTCRAKASVDGNSERLCNDLPSARADLPQEALIAGW